MKATSLLSTIALVGTTMLASAAEQSQLTVTDHKPLEDTANAYRILFIGDSITLHGTNDDVQRTLKWGHLAGMAASKLENDFCHRFATKVQEALPDRTIQIAYPTTPPNFAEAIAKYGLGNAGQYAATIQSSEDLHPNLVVIQLGEHERPGDSLEVTRDNYERLFNSFNTWSPKPAIICTGVWAPGDPLPGDTEMKYRDRAADLDQAVSELCATLNIPFVSVASYALDPSCRGWGETGGVQWHPNDKGHEGYATGLFKAFQALPSSAK